MTVNVSRKEITSYSREIKRLCSSTPIFPLVTLHPSGSWPAGLVANDNWNCRRSCRGARWRRPRTIRQAFNKVDDFLTGEQVFLSGLPKIVEDCRRAVCLHIPRVRNLRLWQQVSPQLPNAARARPLWLSPYGHAHAAGASWIALQSGSEPVAADVATPRIIAGRDPSDEPGKTSHDGRNHVTHRPLIELAGAVA